MSKRKSRKLQIALTVGLLLLGVAAMAALISAKKPPAKAAVEEYRPLVVVQAAESGSMAVAVEGQGTVAPLHESALAAEVAGTVEFISDDLVAGGRFKKGQALVKIDPAEYEMDVVLRRAEVETARKNLQLAKEEVVVAKEEWTRLNLDGAEEGPPPLVAKEPHLKAAAASLEGAEAALAKAKLNLKRCVLAAPFDGRVVEKSVDLGQYLTKGKAVATVYGTAMAEITVNLSDGDLAWIAVPGLTTDSEQGSEAVVTTNFGGQNLTWQGRVVRSAGTLDPKTRLVPVVIRVPEPFASTPPLTPGMYVGVTIRGRALASASVVPRGAVHDGDKVWLAEDGRLRFHPVTVARYFEDKAVLNPALPQGALLVVTNLKVVSDGMAIRTNADRDQPAATATAAPRAAGE